MVNNHTYAIRHSRDLLAPALRALWLRYVVFRDPFRSLERLLALPATILIVWHGASFLRLQAAPWRANQVAIETPKQKLSIVIRRGRPRLLPPWTRQLNLSVAPRPR